MWIELGNAAAKPRDAVKDVTERLPQRLPRRRVRITRDGATLNRVETAQLVEPEDVIRVAMREEHRIDSRQFVNERLLPKVGTRIDKQLHVRGDIEIDGRPQPLVARIDLACAARPIRATSGCGRAAHA